MHRASHTLWSPSCSLQRGREVWLRSCRRRGTHGQVSGPPSVASDTLTLIYYLKVCAAIAFSPLSSFADHSGTLACAAAGLRAATYAILLAGVCVIVCGCV
jgi:hypothetical protein